MEYINSINIFGTEYKPNSCIILDKAPTAETPALIGMLALDTNSKEKDLYKCVAISEGKYEWILLSGAKVKFFNSYSDFEKFQTKDELTDYYVKEENKDNRYFHYRWIKNQGIILIGSDNDAQGSSSAVFVDSLNELETLDKNEFTDYYVKNSNEDSVLNYTHYRWILVSEDKGDFIKIGENLYTKEEIDEKIKAVNDQITAHPEYTLSSEIKEETKENIIYLNKNGSIQSSITIAGGGGSSAPSTGSIMKLEYHPDSLYNYSVKKDNSVIIKFYYQSKDATIENTYYDATYKVRREGDTTVLRQGTIDASQDSSANYKSLVSIDLTDIVKNENCKISVEVTDDKGLTNTVYWNIKIVDISLKLNFNDKAIYTSSQKIKGTFSGGEDKIIEWTLYYTDAENNTKKEETGTIELGNGSNFEIDVGNIKHGSCLLECIGTTKINGETFIVEPVYKDILFYDKTSNIPLIGCIYKNRTITAEEYTVIDIPYYIIHPKTSYPNIIKEIDGKEVSVGNVGERENSWSYQVEKGEHTLSIICEETKVNIKIVGTSLSIDAAPVIDNLEIDFNPVGLNNEFNKNWTYGSYTLKPSKNFDWVNGGYKKDETGEYFLVKAGTTATLNYIMFNKEHFLQNKNPTSEEEQKQGEGQELKIIFKTENVKTPNAVWLTNVLEDGDVKTGLQLGVQNGWIKNVAAKEEDIKDSNGETVFSSNTYLHMTYSEEDIIELDINMEGQKSSEKPFLFYYEDGVPAKAYVYKDAANYVQQETDAKSIVIGSEECDVRIYRLKIYSKALGTKDIMRNFIADSRDIATKLERYKRNSIYYDKNANEYSPYEDDNHKLDLEALAAAMPDVKILHLTTSNFTEGKNKFVKCSLRCIHAPGGKVYPSRGAEDNWIFKNGYHAGQGTTSDSYGKSGRNVDFLFNCDGIHQPSDKISADKEYISTLTRGYGKYGGGKEETETVKDWMGDEAKVSLTENSIPNNFFNFKVNIASSENANNALLAERYDKFLPYVPLSKKRDPRAKIDMEFVPAILFIQEEGENHTEFKDGGVHFYALGNLGDSKKTDYTRAYDPTDMNEFTIEISDNNRNNATFQTGVYKNNKDDLEEIVETVDTEGSYNRAYPVYPISIDKWNNNNFRYQTLYNEKFDGKHSFEPRYACCGEYRDGKLVNENNEFNNSAHKEEELAFMRTCKNQLTKNENVWKAFYRWVITSTDEEFVNEINQWCVKEAVKYFYAFTHIFTMMDNRAKNTFWHFAKTGVYQQVTRPVEELMHIYCELKDGEYINTKDTSPQTEKTYYTQYAFDFWNYDNDTALGINNNGELIFPYGKEDIDKMKETENSGYIFNGAKSIFWLRVRKLFAEVFEDENPKFTNTVSETINTLPSDIDGNTCFSAKSLINRFDKFQNCYPEEIWRLDIERKYIRPFLGTSIDNSIEKSDSNYLEARMQGRKKYQRRQWMRDQEFYFGTKYGFGSMVTDENRIKWRAKSHPADAKFDLEITPYSDMYVRVQYGAGATRLKRASAGRPVEMPEVLKDMNDTDLYVLGSNRISSLGDISQHYPEAKEISLAQGEKLKEIILCSENYESTNLNGSLTLGNHPILEKIDISGENLLSGELDLRNYFNLLELLATGSKLTSILFAPHGKIKKALLPSTITSLSLVNLNNLPLYDEESKIGLKLAEGTRLQKLTIQGGLIDSYNLAMTHKNSLQYLELREVCWTFETPESLRELLPSPYGGLIANSYLTGEVTITGDYSSVDINKFNAAWPDLKIVLKKEKRNITYKNTDGTVLYEAFVSRGSNAFDPISLGEIETPSIVDTEKYKYTFAGWKIGDNIVIPGNGYSVHEDIELFAAYDTVLQTYTVKWISETQNEPVLVVESLPYGNSVDFDTELKNQQKTFEKSLLSRDLLTGGYIGKLFTGWDKSTSFITRDTSPTASSNFNEIIVNAKWLIGKTSEIGTRKLNELNAAEIYAAAKSKTVRSFRQNDYFETLLGNEFDYDNIQSDTMVSINDTKFFRYAGREINNQQPIVTTVKPLKEISSFTLAIDFEFTSFEQAGLLLNCYAEDNRSSILSISCPSASSSSPLLSLSFGGKTTTLVRAKDRQVIVLRYVKENEDGTAGNILYVYTSKNVDAFESGNEIGRFSISGIDLSTLQSDNPITLGGADSTSYRVNANVYWCKIWHEDLGIDDCLKMAQNPRENLRMRYCGTERYSIFNDSNIDDDSQKTGMSFICDHILDKQRYVRPTDILSNENGWGTWKIQDGIGQDIVLNPMREFLEKNIYLSLPQAWQSAISPIKVVSTKGNNSTLTTFTKGHLYVPSVAELIKEPGTSYYAEGSHIDFISSNSARSLMKGRYTNINPETYMSISEPIQSQGISPKLGDKWQKLNNSGYGADRLSFWVPQEEVNKYGIIAGSYDTEVKGLGIWLCAIIYSTRSPAFTDITTSNLWVNMSLNGGPVQQSTSTGPRGVCPCFSI